MTEKAAATRGRKEGEGAGGRLGEGKEPATMLYACCLQGRRRQGEGGAWHGVENNLQSCLCCSLSRHERHSNMWGSMAGKKACSMYICLQTTQLISAQLLMACSRKRHGNNGKQKAWQHLNIYLHIIMYMKRRKRKKQKAYISYVGGRK